VCLSELFFLLVYIYIVTDVHLSPHHTYKTISDIHRGPSWRLPTTTPSNYNVFASFRSEQHLPTWDIYGVFCLTPPSALPPNKNFWLQCLPTTTSSAYIFSTFCVTVPTLLHDTTFPSCATPSSNSSYTRFRLSFWPTWSQTKGTWITKRQPVGVEYTSPWLSRKPCPSGLSVIPYT
jgi:hypothetical protein